MAVTDQGTEVAAPAASSFGDPAPLGLAGFAATTFFLSVVNAGFLSQAVGGAVLGLAIFYGGIGQIIAGLWEFARGNTFGGVAFSSYGGFWLSYWYLVGHLPTARPNDVSHAVGLYLLVWAIFTAYMTVAALKTNGAVLITFVVLTLTYLILAIAWFASTKGVPSSGWTKFGGWVGIVTALAAWYASFAGVTNTTHNKVVLPVFPR